jgi:hypothetical protein
MAFINGKRWVRIAAVWVLGEFQKMHCFSLSLLLRALQIVFVVILVFLLVVRPCLVGMAEHVLVDMWLLMMGLIGRKGIESMV